ncbi:transcriptional regulator, TetR family [Catenulispora acidiphila DSM 44928]|uniref:Transcriptional regulator, TetR family n=1 Tax=Catenulispora acidiphila (strain DSM 44928 / JCM 14897 / NBRC 102108 / NRRL B-24433 / ID139908) TaxID=479433 RepID=C7Q6U3_CATAD|nr:TetR family transcriptional regulator [Catenulispora acidiphila]ACU75956.1 transcriptional regulator, TetR family [Catenulispora acidiphila DSM 44928]
MQRDAEATRQRLIAAGRAEFAAYGITGARVDRIADAAQSNKAQIYHYFTNKAGLFDAVWSDLVEQIVDGLPLEVEDLPGVAVMLCDIYAEHPELPRLITWQRLERGDAAGNEIAAKDSRRRVELIDRALADGVISSRFPADVVFALMLHIAAFWEFTSPDVMRVMNAADRDQRREVVRAVVAAVLTKPAAVG